MGIAILYNSFMFIRASKTKNQKTAEIYIKHQLIESYRTEKGLRQRIILNLGQLNLDKKEFKKTCI